MNAGQRRHETHHFQYSFAFLRVLGVSVVPLAVAGNATDERSLIQFTFNISSRVSAPFVPSRFQLIFLFQMQSRFQLLL
jgi:hypothetical protein